jgi:hypothetical protein
MEWNTNLGVVDEVGHCEKNWELGKPIFREPKLLLQIELVASEEEGQMEKCALQAFNG